MSWAAVFKVAKGVTTFIEVVDGVADAATLGDEIAKSAMGDDYDPAFRDKCQDVAEAGKRVDGLVAQLRARQDDVANLYSSLNKLNLSVDIYEDKNELAADLIDKVGAFSETMAEVPTAMTWVQGPAALTKSHRNQEDVIRSIDAVQAYAATLKFSKETLAFMSTALTLKALIVSYKVRKSYKDRAARRREPVDGMIDGQDIEMRPRLPGERRSAFSGAQMLPQADQRAIRRLRRRVTKAQVVDVVSKATSAISLGYTIYTIVSRVQARNEAMAAFEEQLEEYRKAEQAYGYCIGGFKAYPDTKVAAAAGTLEALQARLEKIEPADGSYVQLEKELDEAERAMAAALAANADFAAAKAFFRVGTAEEWSVSDDIGFAYGVQGLLDQYNAMGQAKLAALRTLFETMLDALSGAKNAEDPTDKIVQNYVIEQETLGQVEKYRTEFEGYAQIAGDRHRKSQTRKDDGFVPIQVTFDRSLQTLMSKVVADASAKLRDIRFASQLYVTAKRILADADAEARKVAARAASQTAQNAQARELVKKLLTAQGRPVTEAEIEKELGPLGMAAERFDRDGYVAAQAEALAREEWVASDLDTEPTERFDDEEAARACLELMILDLQRAASVHVTDAYVWLDPEYSLPLTFSCVFVCGDEKSAFHPCFAREPKVWTGDNDPCLSWFMSANRNDFAFRTGLFARTPTQERHVPGFNVEPGKAYAMRCEIGPTSATYWINNQKYATATYEPKDVPAAGRIGFAVYGRTDVQVDQILVSSG